MGIVNVTPDSFSDGGLYASHQAAVAHGLRLREQGAAAVDIGGESTRPGAERISESAELERVLPVVRDLVEAGVTVSVDTTRARVAAKAVAAGASIVNDVSGGLADPAMAMTIADLGVRYVLVHWRGHSARMHQQAAYRHAAREVTGELRDRADALVSAGVNPEQLILDPGIGFAKTPGHSWDVLASISDLEALGYPILVGASRKSLFRDIGLEPNEPAQLPERDAATAAITAILAPRISWVRVHDVHTNSIALRVAERLQPKVHDA